MNVQYSGASLLNFNLARDQKTSEMLLVFYQFLPMLFFLVISDNGRFLICYLLMVWCWCWCW